MIQVNKYHIDVKIYSNLFFFAVLLKQMLSIYRVKGLVLVHESTNKLYK